MRRPVGRLVHTLATAAIGVAAGLLAVTSPIGSIATPSGAAVPATPDTITRSARIGYLSCPAPRVLLTVSIQDHVFAPGELVSYRVTVRNTSRSTCGTPGRTFPTAPHTPIGLLGPCGELSVVIYDSAGTNVYPGPVAFGCPMIIGPSIPPGQTIAATGTWVQGGIRSAGRYRLVIDGKVTVPVVLAGPTLPSPGTAVSPSYGLPTPTLPSGTR